MVADRQRLRRIRRLHERLKQGRRSLLDRASHCGPPTCSLWAEPRAAAVEFYPPTSEEVYAAASRSDFARHGLWQL